MSWTRRAFFAAPFLAGASGLGLERWCRIVEAERVELTFKKVPLPRLGAPVRVLHIADFHLEEIETLAYLQRCFRMGLDQNPDFVCISGDFITDKLIDFPAYVKTLAQLPAARPTYAVTGNHDGGFWSSPRAGYNDSSLVRKLLEHSGIECLHNRSIELEPRGQKLRLTGVADIWSGESDGAQAFGSPGEQKYPSLLVAHNPDYKDDLQHFPWDLLLAGHTHGGQWRIPVIDWPPYVPIKDRRFLEGLHRWDGRHVHVTRGVGAILRSRLNCRPEVSILDLIPEGAQHA